MGSRTSGWARMAALLVVALLLGWAGGGTVRGPRAPAGAVVYGAPIRGMIDLGLVPYVQRVLDEAAGAGAAAVILQIDTFGGRVDAAVQIRDSLLRSPLRTIAFVAKRPISPGALSLPPPPTPPPPAPAGAPRPPAPPGGGHGGCGCRDPRGHRQGEAPDADH